MKAFVLLVFAFLLLTVLAYKDSSAEEEDISYDEDVSDDYELDDNDEHSIEKDDVLIPSESSEIPMPPGFPGPSYAGTCRYPRHLKHSALKCTKYPRKVVCEQQCVFGYTLKKGRSRTQKCHLRDGIWSPDPDFRDCKPYVDCTVKLVGPGAYTCKTNRMDRGPICKICCYRNGNKPYKGSRLYECNQRGNWYPNLPHCVMPGSDK